MNNSSHQKKDALRTYAVGQSRVLEMNRPTSLNTLNGEMVDAMTESVLVLNGERGPHTYSSH